MSVWIDNYWKRIATSGRCVECEIPYWVSAFLVPVILTSKGARCRYHWEQKRGVEWLTTLSSHDRKVINRVYHRLIPRQPTWKATQALMRFRYKAERQSGAL